MRFAVKQPIASLTSRILSHIRLPLFYNGYALVLSSAATSGLGMLYWILAARFYQPDAIGLNAAVLSSILFLSNIAQFNLYNALNRFLPTAGRATRRLVLRSYLVSSLIAVLVSLIFLWGISIWAPRLAFLKENPVFSLLFILFTVCWGFFAIQDSALTGLRRSVWVPVENVLFSILKIILLVTLASLIPEFGVLVSWLVPLALSLILVNLFLFRFLIPAHIRETETREQPVMDRQIVQYVGGDYIGAMFWVGVTTLQTVIVTQLMGTSAAAHFYLPWQIAYALYLVSRMMGMSLVAEVAADPAKLTQYSLRVLVQIARLLLPAVALILLGAPLILRIFGQEYAAEGTSLLRLLSLSAIPQMVIALYLSMARIQRKVTALIVVQAGESILALLFIYGLLPRYGLTGMGWAWLISQTIAGLVVGIIYLRPVAFPQFVPYLILKGKPWKKN